MSSTIKINTADGGSFSAYVANKKGVQGRAILLIQEIFGVNQTMRDLADDFSLLGYVVVCPDLFCLTSGWRTMTRPTGTPLSAITRPSMSSAASTISRRRWPICAA